MEEKPETAAASFGPQQKAASEGVEVLVENTGTADGVAGDHELACWGAAKRSVGYRWKAEA